MKMTTWRWFSGVHRWQVLWLACGGLLIAIVIYGALRRVPPVQQQAVSADSSAGHHQPHGDRKLPPDPSGSYVGSQICAECHGAIADLYAQHPMSYSTRLISEDHSEDATQDSTLIAAGQQRILFAESPAPGGMIHHEQIRESSGQPLFDLEYPMDLVIGSGQRAKAYVHRRGEVLCMSPLNWYAQAQRWGLAPGYRMDDPRRFDRRVNVECLACHTGRLTTSSPGINVFPQSCFLEMSIGCERCHGPGQEHVTAHQASLALSPEDDPIINPARLDHVRRDSICDQCHLSAVRVLHPGLTALDFRPGMPLSDVWSILDTGPEITVDGRTRFVNHVQQMRSSRCYAATAGALACISCHDPHQIPEESRRIDFYRERCMKCHTDHSCSAPEQERQAREDSCVSCHMPELPTSNVSHVAQTDHRILRLPERQTGTSGPASKPVELTFLGDMAAQLTATEQQRAHSLGMYIYCSRKNLEYPPELSAQLRHAAAEFPQDASLWNALGTMAAREQNLDLMLYYYQQASRATGEREVALSGLLDVAYLTRDWTRVIEYSDQLLAIDSGDYRLQTLRADALMQLGQIDASLVAIQNAIRLNPGDASLHDWLAKQYIALGKPAEAAQEQQFLQRLRSAKLPENISRPAAVNDALE